MRNRKPPTYAELRGLYESIHAKSRAPADHRSPVAENLTRMDRALSWLARCEATDDDAVDERFLFLWITFNAAYGDDRNLKPSADDGVEISESQKLGEFLGRIVARDAGYRLADIIRLHHDEFRTLIDNRFLYNPFWKAEYNEKIRHNWESTFAAEKQRAHEALDDEHLETNQTREILHITFNRLYTLRNQILHGGASWRDRYNRSSLASGDAILGLLVPEILRFMLDAMQEQPDRADWGSIAYPPYLETPDDTTRGPPGATPSRRPARKGGREPT